MLLLGRCIGPLLALDVLHQPEFIVPSNINVTKVSNRIRKKKLQEIPDALNHPKLKNAPAISLWLYIPPQCQSFVFYSYNVFISMLIYRSLVL